MVYIKYIYIIYIIYKYIYVWEFQIFIWPKCESPFYAKYVYFEIYVFYKENLASREHIKAEITNSYLVSSIIVGYW